MNLSLLEVCLIGVVVLAPMLCFMVAVAARRKI